MPHRLAPVILALSLVGAASPAEPLFGGIATECATPLDPQEAAIARALADAGVYSLFPRGTEGWIYVPLTFHVVRRSNGTGGISQTQLDTAFSDANAAYAPIKIAYCLPGPIDYIDSDAFYDIGSTGEANQLRLVNVVPDTINIYFVNSAPFCGISAFTFSATQQIVMNNTCTGLPTNHSTFSHEIGHYWDLFHTHESAFGPECVSGSNCSNAGDQVCDTAADPGLSTSNVSLACLYTGVEFGPCSGDPRYAPDPRNYMSYSRKECRDVFTPGQFSRARATLINLRSNLANFLAGDTNGDGVVSFADLNTVLAQFGQSGALTGDVNGDGIVNFGDLNSVLAAFGAHACA